MPEVSVKHFEADGALVNLNLGFVPSYVEVRNAGASVGEVAKIVAWKDQLGTSEFQTDYVDASDGGSHAVESFEESTLYLAEYDSDIVGNRQSVVFDEAGGGADDLCTVSGGHGYAEGEKVHLIESGGLPTGLSEGTAYYVKYLTLTTFQVSLTSGGAAVEMTGDGSTPNYVFSIDNLETGSGFKGITIAADFMDDGEEIYVYAVLSDIDKDEGDING